MHANKYDRLATCPGYSAPLDNSSRGRLWHSHDPQRDIEG